MRIILSALLWLLVALPASASMLIDRAIIQFEAGSASRQDVTVSNPTENTMFLEVEVLQVTDPGTENERREVVRDPESIGLLAAPRRLAVPAGGRRLVRLVNLGGHGDQERVYRVNITPVTAPSEVEGEGISVGVRGVVAYQLWIVVGPQTPQVALQASRDGDQLFLHNAGNVNIMLSKGLQCPGNAREDDCVEIQARRLYPGNEVTLSLPMDAAVTFQKEVAGKRSRLRLD